MASVQDHIQAILAQLKILEPMVRSWETRHGDEDAIFDSIVDFDHTLLDIIDYLEERKDG